MVMVDKAFIKDAVELESRWSTKVGGPEMEPVRTIIGFALAQLQSAGATIDNLDAYFSEVFAMLRRAG